MMTEPDRTPIGQRVFDTFNKYAVGVQGRTIVILRPPTRLSARDALLLAAYLVTLAETADPETRENGTFADWLNAVQNT